jgi:hypothetical protein
MLHQHGCQLRRQLLTCILTAAVTGLVAFVVGRDRNARDGVDAFAVVHNVSSTVSPMGAKQDLRLETANTGLFSSCKCLQN